jgi:hypothetical protein
MAIQALLIPALTSFAISKLTGSSTKSALRNALLAGATAGITEGFTAKSAARCIWNYVTKSNFFTKDWW